jgi:hypothetical protein
MSNTDPDEDAEREAEAQEEADALDEARLNDEADDDLGISDDNWACGTLDPET